MSLILQDQLTLSTKTKEQVEKNTEDIAKNTQDIQDLEGKLAVVYKFKGSVDTYADLPTENNQAGDVWDVKEDDMNYAWTDDGKWDKLGPTVDLSGYVPTSRTINNKALDSDITLEPSDIGAATAAQGELADTALQEADLKTINGESIIGEGNIIIDSLPNQAGNAGKSLYTDGIDASWKITRDPNTYRSLSDAQATTLLSDGTYNGVAVTNGEIFTSADGAFKQYSYTTAYTANFTTGGDVTTTDGIATFGTGGAIFSNYTFSPSSNTWKIVFSVTPNFNGGDYQQILGFSGLVITETASKIIHLYIPSITDSYGQTILSDSVKYDFEFSFTGSAYILKLKQSTSTEWITEFIISSSSTIPSGAFTIGADYKYESYYNYWHGSIDLNVFTAEINDEVVWTPYEYVYTRTLSPLSYNKTAVDTALLDKQDTLAAGNGITLTNNTVTNTLATDEGKLDPNAFAELAEFEELKANVYKIPAVPRVDGSTTNQSKRWLDFPVYPNLYYKGAAQEQFVPIDEDFAQALVISGSDDVEIRLPFDITRKGLDKEYASFRYSLYLKLQREAGANDGVIICADYPNGDKFFKLYVEDSKIKAIFGNEKEWDNTTIVASEEEYLDDIVYNGFIEIDIQPDSQIAEGSTNTFRLTMSDVENQENSISLDAEGFTHPDTYRLYFSRNLEDGSSWWGGKIPMEDLHFTNSEYSIIWSCLTIADMKKAASTSLSNLDSIGQAVLDAKQDSLTTGTGIDITDGTISVTAPTLTNLSTNAEGLVVGSVGTTQGALIAYGCTAIGKGINAVGPSQVLIGNRVESKIGYSSAIATTVIGAHAKSSAHGNIALGAGCNNTEAGTFKVSLSTTGAIESFTTYTVLDSNGRIPAERLGEIIILGEDDPTENTEGTLGLIYKNTLTGELFRCSAIEEGTSTKLYTWVKLVDASNTYSKAEIDAMIGNIETRLAQV